MIPASKNIAETKNPLVKTTLNKKQKRKALIQTKVSLTCIKKCLGPVYMSLHKNLSKPIKFILLNKESSFNLKG